MITNETYDVLKLWSEVILPAFQFLIVTLGEIWNIPWYAQIAATVAALATCLGMFIRKSRKAYYEDVDGYDERDEEEEYIEEDMTDDIEGEEA